MIKRRCKKTALKESRFPAFWEILTLFLCQIAKITILAEFWVQQTQRHKNCVFAVLKMWKTF